MSPLTGSTPTFFIKVPVPSQESERSCICVLEVMHLCVRDIDVASFYDFDISFWNCYDSVVFYKKKTQKKHVNLRCILMHTIIISCIVHIFGKIRHENSLPY